MASGSVFGPTDMSYDWVGTPSVGVYRHKANTFINTPDQTFSNVKAAANIVTPVNRVVFDLYSSPAQLYFELASGYPRNHYTHKLQQFSKWKYGDYFGKVFVKGRQTTDSTINGDGINDGSPPVWSSNTSNVNVVSTGNILRTVPTIIAGGQAAPSGTTTTVATTTAPAVRQTEQQRAAAARASRVNKAPSTAYVLPVAVWGSVIRGGIVYYRLILADADGKHLHQGQFVNAKWIDLWKLMMGQTVNIDGTNYHAIPANWTAFWKIQMGLNPLPGILG
jgi:hypothetical protein